MQFTLTYRGPLKSNARPVDKHKLRQHFHGQFKLLWSEYPLNECRDFLLPHTQSETSILRTLHGFTFAPLVCEKMRAVAELDIKLLWPQPPGFIITGGGDIDNRLKTLFDALKLPSEPTALPSNTIPGNDENPFYCLLEDDSLIARVNVDADRLLEKSDNPAEVILFIDVKTRNLGNGFWDCLP